MNQPTRNAAFLAIFFLAGGCGLFQSKNPDNRSPDSNPPKQGSTESGNPAGGMDWGSKIGSTGFDSHSDRIGIASIDTLAMGGAPSALKIAAFLEDPSLGVRRHAVESLAKFGKEAEPALPKVLEVCRNADVGLRTTATQALALIGSKAATDRLKNASKDKSPAVSVWGHAGLSKINDDCEDHLEDVAKILRAGPGPVSAEAAEATRLMECPNADVIAILVDALRKEDDVRVAAARALGFFGPKASEAVPSLIGLLTDKAWPVRQAALLALSRIGEPAVAAVPLLIQILGDPAPRFRELAAHALEGIGPKAQPAIEPLKKAVLDSEPSVQAAAKRALAAIQPQPAATP
jgi:HEAT repeat protein